MPTKALAQRLSNVNSVFAEDEGEENDISKPDMDVEEDISDDATVPIVVPMIKEEEPVTTPLPPANPNAPQESRSRLVIHQLVLINFKSYAGRQTIGPFHKSFSAIVGPNGSGKSNTIDALLFVFGYRASKMRQGKLSELIHNSDRYPNFSECGVEVHFREIVDLPGSDNYTVVPKSDIIVSRTAYKNNTSKYTINNRSSNFTEVTTLLKTRGIDLDHKRFLILQGEVESIAQMKPKAQTEHEDGLLEYLEDIIGTSSYKEPIEEALLEVDKYNEERAQKLNRLRIVEKEKNALEDAKRETETYLRLQNDLARAQSRLYQWNMWQASENINLLQQEIGNLQGEMDLELEKNKDDLVHAEQLEAHYNERVATYEEIRLHCQEVLKALATHEKQEVGLKEKKKHLTSKAKKISKNVQEDNHSLSEAKRELQDNTRRVSDEKGRLQTLESSLSDEETVLEKIRDSLKDKTQVFHDQIEAKQKALEPWAAKINQCQSALDVASGERDALSSRLEGLKKSLEESEQEVTTLNSEKKQKGATLSELREKKDALKLRMSKQVQLVKELSDSLQAAKAKANTARAKAEEAKSTQMASTSQNAVLDSLLRLKQSGRITGFHGRLGSLGTIPEQYDVAISTACGMLNHLVVDTVEQGQTCIEYLRRQNVGRASFLVLEKLGSTTPEVVATPENVPRLYDLVQPKDARFSPAFFKAIGNTLVATDLEQANRIAFGSNKRWRVVTLGGQLIDTAGTMSGGGTKVMKGVMSSRLAPEGVDPSTLRRYERECEELTKQVDELAARLKEAQESLDRVKADGPKFDIEIQKFELEMSTLQKRSLEAAKRSESLKAHSKPDAKDTSRIKELDQLMASSKKTLDSLQANSKKIEVEIQELEQKILDVGGSKMLAQKSKVDGIRLRINLATDEITRAEVAITKAGKDIVKLEASIRNHESALEELQQEAGELDEQLGEVVATVNGIRSRVEEAQTATEHAKDDLEGIKADLDEQLKIIQKFRAKEMDIQQKLGERKKELSENEKSLQHSRNLHDNISLEDVDDEDDDAETPVNDGSLQDGEVKPKVTENNELKMYGPEELSKYNKRALVADIGLLEERLRTAKVDLNVLKEYRKREKEFLERAKDLERVTNLRDESKQKYDDLRKTRLERFMLGFNAISSKLKEMYQMITLGGNAELELVDSMDPFSEGIIFSVMPPKKSWKNISNLSGGEKTLSSLALVFALHVFKPTPLYFMDEIDAALDFRNVSIVANYIKDRTKNAQFIIISLRNDMFELSHRLIGIYKTANATQSIAIDNKPLSARS